MTSGGLLSELEDDQDYFGNIDFHSMDDDELQRLSPRRRYLIEFERLLDVELPATRKIHRGDNWRKNSPNVTNADLKQLIIGICQTYGETPKVAKELRTDALHLRERERDVFECLLEAGDEYRTAEEIANQLGNEFGFEEDLQGRFDQNPLTASGNAFFPDQCMSYGCTAWAVRQSRALVSHFGRKVGVDMRPLQ